MASEPLSWYVDDHQRTYVETTFDLTVAGEVEVRREDIDRLQSLNVGQNRAEMDLDRETVEILGLYMAEGVAHPMPIVWKPTNRKTGKYVVLDGNHRMASAFELCGAEVVPCLLVVGDTQLAQRFAMVVNTLHGRSTRDPSYVAATMRQLKGQGMRTEDIARMFGVSETSVRRGTNRDLQAERVRKLVPDYRAQVKVSALDVVGNLEDDHLRVLGEPFLLAPRAVQDDIVARIKGAPSADRATIAHEAVGELRAADRARRRIKATTPRPSSQLLDGLQRLTKVIDPRGAYFSSTDQQRAVLRSNLATVRPRLDDLAKAIDDGAV